MHAGAVTGSRNVIGAGASGGMAYPPLFENSNQGHTTPTN